MALIRADRVKESSTSTGTGAFTLAGAATGYRTFSSVCAIGDIFYYAISNQSNGEWESGLGTYSAANTLTRTTVHASSNSGNAVTFSAGTKEVFVTLTAAQLNGILDTSGITGTLAVAKGGTGATTGTAAAANLVNSAPNDGLEYTLKSKKTNGAVSYYWVDSTGYAPTLDLLFAADKSLTAYNGPTPTFSRASTGTFFNSSGVLTSAAIGTPRFNHTFNGTSWVSRGLLVEDQRTNFSEYSESIVNWTQDGATTTSDQISAPDGNLTADLVAETAVNSYHAVYNASGGSVTAGQTWTQSVFVKKGNGASAPDIVQLTHFGTPFGTTQYCNFNLSTGVITASSGGTGSIVNCGNGWYRIAWTATAVLSGVAGVVIFFTNNNPSATRVPSYTGSTSANVFVWGGQVEQGSFATSYIRNISTGSTTRSADVCQITGSDFSGFWNGTEGSFVADFDFLATPADRVSPRVWYVSDGAYTNGIWVQSGTSDGFYVYQGGSSQAALTATALGAGVSTRIASAYKLNDFAASFNGAAVSTDTSGNVPTVNRLEIGYMSDISGRVLNGHIARLRYYPVRLPNATLQVLST